MPRPLIGCNRKRPGGIKDATSCTSWLLVAPVNSSVAELLALGGDTVTAAAGQGQVGWLDLACS